jgi:hypothetical protein
LLNVIVAQAAELYSLGVALNNMCWCLLGMGLTFGEDARSIVIGEHPTLAAPRDSFARAIAVSLVCVARSMLEQTVRHDDVLAQLNSTLAVAFEYSSDPLFAQPSLVYDRSSGWGFSATAPELPSRLYSLLGHHSLPLSRSTGAPLATAKYTTENPPKFSAYGAAAFGSTFTTTTATARRK